MLVHRKSVIITNIKIQQTLHQSFDAACAVSTYCCHLCSYFLSVIRIASTSFLFRSTLSKLKSMKPLNVGHQYKSRLN